METSVGAYDGVTGLTNECTLRVINHRVMTTTTTMLAKTKRAEPTVAAARISTKTPLHYLIAYWHYAPTAATLCDVS